MTIQNKIRSLLEAANAKTSAEDEDLTSAVQSLIDGYGQGGQTVYYQDPSDNSLAFPYVPILTFPYNGMPSPLRGAHYLEEVHAPEYAKDIGSNAFRDCERLRVADFPKATAIGGGNTYQGCAALETVYVPRSTNIGAAVCFSGCGSLQEIQAGSIGYPVTQATPPSNIFSGGSGTAEFTLTIYVAEDRTLPIPNQPWGARGATIVYRSAETGEVIPVE